MRSDPTSPDKTRREVLALVLIVALAAFFRTYGRLGDIPPGFHYDEAYEALEAWRVSTQPGYHPIFFPGNFGVEPMFIYLASLAFRLFGATPAVMRAVAATVGTLTVPAVYAFAKELSRADAQVRPITALLAALVLATMPWHVLFSRVGIEPVLVPFFLCLILWALWRALRTNRLWTWGVLGLAMGGSLYTYPAGRLLPLAAAASAGLFLAAGMPKIAQILRAAEGPAEGQWRAAGLSTAKGQHPDQESTPDSENRARPRIPWQGFTLAAAIVLIVAMPLIVQFSQHPDQLLLRSSQIAVRSAGVQHSSLAQNLLATLGMFNIRGDQDPRSNVPGMPALNPLMSIPFLIGFGISLWRWRRPAFSSLLLVGLLMLTPTIFSEFAPHFRRALGAAPIVALLCGIGLAAILGSPAARPATLPGDVPWRLKQGGASPENTAARMDRLRWLGRVAMVSALLFGSAVLSAQAYFGRWASDPALYYAYDEGLWEIGGYLRSLPSGNGEVILVTPRPRSDATLGFALRQGNPVRHFDGRRALPIPFGASGTAGPATYVVIEHEDFRSTGLLQELFPQAVEVRRFIDRAGEVYARVLRVPDVRARARSPQFSAKGNWPGVELIGYDLNRENFRPGDIVYLQLWWRADGPPLGREDWTVFTHLLGSPRNNGTTLWAGDDAQPGQGSLPFSGWQPDDLVLDEYQLRIPEDAPSGEYQIEVGLYSPIDGRRATLLAPPGQDRLLLKTVTVR